MAIIDRVKYDGPADVLVWRHPTDDLSWGTQVIVNQSQEALFYSGGQALDILLPGTHTLKTANIPLLRTLIKIPFGGETPFAAEVYYVNRAVNLDVKWGTSTPIPVQDPKFNVFLPVRAHGQFGVQVSDSRKIVTKLAGTMREFTVEAMREYFKGVLLTRAKDYIAETITKQKISLLEINAHLEEMSQAISDKLAEDFGQYGIKLVNFYLHSVDAPEEDDTVKRLKKALSDRAEMDIMGAGYDKKRTFDTLEKAAESQGGAGMGMGLGVGMGAGAGIGGLMAGVMGQAAAAKPAGGIACPSCRADNPAGARFCSGCGKPLGAAKCPKCQTELPAGAKFCSSCGEKTGA
ncbi:MAG: SPFH domain-containing protein [Elusimicrobia bacterium]|nr:SPFH domain-containing protein [Elusimicrobiota bacterium]